MRPINPYLQAILVPLVCTGLLILLVPWIVRQSDSLPQDELNLLRAVHQLILERHVLEQEPHELMHEAIAGMVGSLDRHSRYVPPQDAVEFGQNEITGTYKGVGVLMLPNHSPPTITFPLPDGPADRLGLRPGDQILAVNGEDIRSVSAENAVATAIDKIKGLDGNVRLLVGRPEQAEFELELPREAVRKPAIRWPHFADQELKIAYLQVVDFQRGMIDEFDQAIAALRKQGMRALIVDLRQNPGGLLLQATALANRFLSDGDIVVLKNRDGMVTERHLAEPERCSLPELPTAVLIDGSSASASEVFSGALQDRRRATIIGTRSFGKGVVQEILQLTDQVSLKLTTSHYYTPSGRNIERQLRRPEDGNDPGGIEPDVHALLSDEERNAVLVNLHPNNHAPALEWVGAVSTLYETLDRTGPTPPDSQSDSQLAAGIEALRTQLKDR